MSDKNSDVDFEKFAEQLEEIAEWKENVQHQFDSLAKAIDDIMWYQRIRDLAVIDKINLLGPPPGEDYPQKYLASPEEKENPVKIKAYTFIPKEKQGNQKLPLLVFPHGGVHSNFHTFYVHIVKELLKQGYIIVAPEYRGSTGYGEKFYKMIDYGGLEVEDTYSTRNWMVENEELVDKERIGILGWSHGGLHALMNVFEYPDAYEVAYSCVPVSDLVARMAYKGQDYRDLCSADYHIGDTAGKDLEEYRRRSPAWNAEKLDSPLLVHANTSDEDVNVLEVEHLIKSLKAKEKDFEYKIYEDAPGGHMFNRLDTQVAVQSREEVYDFLAKYLNPPLK